MLHVWHILALVYFYIHIYWKYIIIQKLWYIFCLQSATFGSFHRFMKTNMLYMEGLSVLLKLCSETTNPLSASSASMEHHSWHIVTSLQQVQLYKCRVWKSNVDGECTCTLLANVSVSWPNQGCGKPGPTCTRSWHDVGQLHWQFGRPFGICCCPLEDQRPHKPFGIQSP